MEFVSGRSKEEVKDHVVSVINTWVEEATHEDYECGDVDSASLIKSKLSSDTMLDRDDAKWLQEILEADMRREMAKVIDKRGQLGIMDIDELSIYPDAWGLYCRPGTYSV